MSNGANTLSARKYLIVAVGTECYVTLPKGQIIPTHDEQRHMDGPTVPGGGHVLIVPISHYPTLAAIAPDIAPPILDEIDRSAVDHLLESNL